MTLRGSKPGRLPKKDRYKKGAGEYSREWRLRNPGKAYAYNKKWRHRDDDSRKDRQRAKARNYARGAAHLSLLERATNRPWTPTDDRVVIEHKKADRLIAVELRRSVVAVQGRRSRLKKLAGQPVVSSSRSTKGRT